MRSRSDTGFYKRILRNWLNFFSFPRNWIDKLNNCFSFFDLGDEIRKFESFTSSGSLLCPKSISIELVFRPIYSRINSSVNLRWFNCKNAIWILFSAWFPQLAKKFRTYSSRTSVWIRTIQIRVKKCACCYFLKSLIEAWKINIVNPKFFEHHQEKKWKNKMGVIHLF